MDYSYTHDDATMVVFDLYKKMLEETGYSSDSPNDITFEQLNEAYGFYGKLFDMLKDLGYISPETKRIINKVLTDIYDRAIFIKAGEMEAENPDIEAEFFENFKKGVFYDGIDG